MRVGTYPTRNFATVEQFTLLLSSDWLRSLMIAHEVGLYHLLKIGGRRIVSEDSQLGKIS